MRSSKGSVAFFTVVSVCLTGASLTVAQEIVVRGTVRSQDGRDVQGDITVSEGVHDVRIRNYRTDQFGTFSISYTAASTVRLIAKADGYCSAEVALAVRPGVREMTHSFQLSPTAVISGRVLDHVGAGVPDATVFVRYVGEQRSLQFAEEVRGTKTDDFGYFVVPGACQGKRFVLDAVSDSQAPSSSNTLVAQSAKLTDVVISLRNRGQLLSGRVVDSAGQSVKGVGVRLLLRVEKDRYSTEEKASLSLGMSTNRVAEADADGRFQFAGVPSGEAVLIAGSGSRRTRHVVAVNDRPVEVNLVFDK